jgi:hypothetical protein
VCKAARPVPFDGSFEHDSAAVSLIEQTEVSATVWFGEGRLTKRGKDRKFIVCVQILGIRSPAASDAAQSTQEILCLTEEDHDNSKNV